MKRVLYASVIALGCTIAVAAQGREGLESLRTRRFPRRQRRTAPATSGGSRLVWPGLPAHEHPGWALGYRSALSRPVTV